MFLIKEAPTTRTSVAIAQRLGTDAKPQSNCPIAGICGYWGRADTEQGRHSRWICLILIKFLYYTQKPKGGDEMKIEIRSANEAIIEGYVNAVERDSRLLPKIMCPEASSDFVEQVRAGAFRRALQNVNKVELMYNHEKVIGSTGSNLELREDSIGLYARAAVTDADVIKAAESGLLKGWSFGFNCLKDQWEPAGENRQRRFLEEIRLYEVSILDKKPAYIGTSIEMRSFEGSGGENEGKPYVIFEKRGCHEDFEISDSSLPEKENKEQSDENSFLLHKEMCGRRIEYLKMKGM